MTYSVDMSDKWIQTDSERAVIPALVYIRLKQAITRTRELLQTKKHEGDMRYIAWLARNLVELRIWTEYCSISEANAQEFNDDAVRDLVELDMRIPGLDVATKAELDDAASALTDMKALHKFKEISDAGSGRVRGPFFVRESSNRKISKPWLTYPLSELWREFKTHVPDSSGSGPGVTCYACRRELVEGCCQVAFRQIS
jgi:hypothetical protein